MMTEYIKYQNLDDEEEENNKQIIEYNAYNAYNFIIPDDSTYNENINYEELNELNNIKTYDSDDDEYYNINNTIAYLKRIKKMNIHKYKFDNLSKLNKGSFIKLNYMNIRDIKAVIIKKFNNKLIVEILPITNEPLTIKPL